MSRYQRQLNLPGFGPEGQRRLSNASVLVVGAGGLGVPVLQYLCAMGVGQIGIVDGDRVQLTNLQRQVLYVTSDIGLLKAERAAERLRAMNPDVQLDVFPEMLTPQNALEILQPYDLIVDATDVFSARYLINDACVMLRKPWVFGAVHQYEGQLSVFNYEGGPTYRCLFPVQPGPAEIPDCELGGVLGIVPGLVGSRQAMEAVKVLTGIGSPLSGTVLMLDFLRDTEFRMRLKPVAANQNINALQDSYESGCGPATGIGPDELRTLMQEHVQLWDVREPHEFAAGHLQGAICVPLSVINDHAAALVTDRPVVMYCQKGSRSAVAAVRLLELRPELKVHTLNGGIAACPPQLYGR